MIFFAQHVYASEIIVHDVEVRPALAKTYPTSIYFDIDNTSDVVDYLLEVKLLDYPEIKAQISKTVFDKDIARIIQIDRLALPAYAKINSSALRIFILAEGIPVGVKKLRLGFVLASGKMVEQK